MTKIHLHENVEEINVGSPTVGDNLVWNGTDWIDEEPTIEPRSVVFYIPNTATVGLRNMRFAFAFTSGSLKATKVRVDVNTAPTGSALSVQLLRYNSSGSAAVGTASVTAGSYSGEQSTLSNQYLYSGYWWQVNVTAVGSTVAGADITVQVIADPIAMSKRKVT